MIAAVRKRKKRVLIVTGKNPAAAKANWMREAAEAKAGTILTLCLLITEEFLKLLPAERRSKAPEMLKDQLTGHHGDVIMLDRAQTFFVPVFNIDPKSVIDELGKPILWSLPGRVMNNGLKDKFGWNGIHPFVRRQLYHLECRVM